ncbi:hypothetical protein ILYODFUR_019737 [Ilyodon furcidens]|uniref:Uncharacterized protein n=1 Tax=Ilyodon furcidens TaxID=33524 RepID=A0ABV0VFF2_9TELE
MNWQKTTARNPTWQYLLCRSPSLRTTQTDNRHSIKPQEHTWSTTEQHRGDNNSFAMSQWTEQQGWPVGGGEVGL